MWFYSPGKYLIKDGFFFWIEEAQGLDVMYTVSYNGIDKNSKQIIICRNNFDVCNKYLDEIFKSVKDKGENYVVL